MGTVSEKPTCRFKFVKTIELDGWADLTMLQEWEVLTESSFTTEWRVIPTEVVYKQEAEETPQDVFDCIHHKGKYERREIIYGLRRWKLFDRRK